MSVGPVTRFRRVATLVAQGDELVQGVKGREPNMAMTWKATSVMFATQVQDMLHGSTNQVLSALKSTNAGRNSMTVNWVIAQVQAILDLLSTLTAARMVEGVGGAEFPQPAPSRSRRRHRRHFRSTRLGHSIEG